jgi:hypothetical protein
LRFKFTAGFGWFDDDGPCEGFLNCSKAGTAVDKAEQDSAITASIAFQHGAPLDEQRHALTRDGDGRASGPLAATLDLLEESS